MKLHKIELTPDGGLINVYVRFSKDGNFFGREYFVRTGDPDNKKIMSYILAEIAFELIGSPHFKLSSLTKTEQLLINMVTSL